MNGKKIGIITMLAAVTGWLFFEGVGFILGMNLRPKMITVLIIVFCIGLLIFSIAASVDMLRTYRGSVIKTVMVMVFEFVMVVAVIGLCTLNFVLSPVESINEKGLALDYYNGQAPEIFEEYNWFYYR